MKRYTKLVLIALFSIFSIAIFSRITGGYTVVFDESQIQVLIQADDTIPRFSVKKTQVSNYEDLTKKQPIDLKDPENLTTEVEYDINTGLYIFKTKLGDQVISTPISLNYEEYMKHRQKEFMSKYFQKKNSIARTTGTHKSNDFMLKNVTVYTSDLDKVFGPGGLDLKLSGYAEATLGLKNTKTENPALSQRNRNRTMFDFDQDIQMNVDATVGDKINFGLNYDTKAAFDFDSKKIKLAYEGKEDEILKRIEAGNVSMSTTNSLINGGAALFGINTELQFGRLRVNAIASQQEAESRTIQTQGSVQNNEYEFKADEYDENRHFFLGRYFYDHYDQYMSLLPAVSSGIVINRMEVWVTNKRGGDDARNIVAFADLGEADWRGIGDSPDKLPTVTNTLPQNRANTLYDQLTQAYSAARDISRVESTLSGVLEGGQAYEKVERARLLSSTEYSYNEQLGYISLTSALQSDEVLGVAFEYTYKGSTYQIGEFGADITDAGTTTGSDSKSGTLFVKMLKPASLSPISYTWDLMMKNVYSLGANNIQQEGFRLQIAYQSDTLGAYITYLPEGAIKNKPLLNVMNLDRLNKQNKAVSNDKQMGDGVFDFLEGFTVRAESGRIFFPVVEPFGSHLKKQINNPAIAEKYIYQELYDDTKTAAQQVAEKNKFKIYGSYRGNVSSGAEINLNATNVPQGSVKVTAAGVKLQEGVDYIVDYMSGSVTIINQNLIDSNTPVQVSLEDQTFSMQKKTMLGLNLSYDFSKNFNVGATVMHLYEKPLMNKTVFGEESVKNTLWGFNFSYNTQSQWLTNMIDKLPFVEATQPSNISFNGEFAQLIAGHYQDGEVGKYSYLDDFESSESRIDLKNPYAWTLASTPITRSEANNVVTDEDRLKYGMERAQLSWFMIDNIFTRQGTSQRIKDYKDQLSNHFVREILLRELYPNRDVAFNDVGTITALNLSYYPTERGPYNLNTVDIGSDGKFQISKVKDKWGGVMRRMDVRDFETSNIEYIEFWLLDPFVYNDTASVKNQGGDLYFNLGNISEDILKDGKKFFENGLPIDGNMNDVETTVWGKVPKRQATVYAFDNENGTAGRKAQDVGLNGLSTEEEFEYPTYKKYLDEFRAKLSSAALDELNDNPFSPLRDPSGDNYHYYRGSYYDEHETSILDRYKYFNGTEGNSPTADGSNERYSTAARTVPDVEDIDQDFTMNETESFYEYRISLRPQDMNVGSNYITEVREVEVPLKNGDKQFNKVKWYQFKIPVSTGEAKGNIRNFKSIRYMRMYLTQFEQPTFLRFGTLQLVRGDWRTYGNTLNQNEAPSGPAKIEVTRVNIEENGNKEPVNYVLPPGLDRSQEANQAQILQNNEQALSMKITDLDPRDARAVYKNTNYDLRRFKRLQMFTHLEELIDGETLEYGDFTVFIRLGSDYKNNYYEYEIPMRVTPPRKYTNSDADRYIVWPKDNMFDFSLEEMKNVKLERNKEKRKADSDVSYTKLYWRYDRDNPANKVSVMGNPSLAEVNVIMIGVRNNSRRVKSGEIWVNELRLTDFDEKGGWAAQGNLSIALSDIGTINVSGRKETAGFGALDQSLLERRSDDYSLYNVALNMDLGRFIPAKAKVSIPFYYSYSNEKITPEYDPFDTDVKLKESLKSVNTKVERDSIRSLAEEVHKTKSLNFSNVKVNIKSKTPMPYDPANLSFGYSYNESEVNNPTTVYDINKDFQANINYSYSPIVKTWEPFSKLQGNAGAKKFLKSIGFNYLPNNITANSVMTRFYAETLTRDIENYRVGEANVKNEFLSWSQSFYWDRDLSISWDFTKNLKATFQSGTRAEIEEPYRQVNKKQNRDDYEIWKDSVWRSIRNMGDPLSYRQVAKLTYQLPTRSIPALDWITSQAEYTSGYQWDRGAMVGIDTLEVGNTISNSILLETRNRFDLIGLYRKNSFLKRVNERFDNRRSNRQTSRRPERQTDRNTARKRRYTTEIELVKDSVYVLKHNLNSKQLDIVAKKDGKPYKLKYKRIDNNTIQIKNKDEGHLQLSMMAKIDESESSGFWKDVAEYSARGLMSLRSVSFNYATRKETYINGFKPKIGDMLGQRNTSDYGMVPGMGFAFGLDGGHDYIDKALDREWLLSKSISVTPAIYNSTQKMEIMAVLEPIKGLKIDLNAAREHNKRSEINFYDNRNVMVGDHPVSTMRGGSFSMTTIALSSAFESGNAKNGYKSEAFDDFLKNRIIILERLQYKYNSGANIPNSGFIQEDGLTSGRYVERLGQDDANPMSINSSDVMIPAFLAAYTGGNAKKTSLNLIPKLWSLLPNWSVTYDGLSNVPFIKNYAKSVRLNHRYTCFYQIGSYTSYNTWVDAGDGFGFIRDALSGKPTPSSPYNMSSVSIVEAFNPLFGAETVLNNSLLFNLRYNNMRTLNLNSSSYQIVESLDKEWVVGCGYRINDFNRILGISTKDSRRQNRNRKNKAEGETPVPAGNEINNDLNIKFDLSHRTQQALIRKINENYTQATSGTTIFSIKFSADYTLSRSLTLRAFYDRVLNKPLITSVGYATTNSSFGISLKFTLQQ